MFKWNKNLRGAESTQRSPGSIMIVLGLLMFCLLLPAWQGHIFAQEADGHGGEHCRVVVSPDTPFELKGMEPGDSCDRSFSVTNPGKLPVYLWLKFERVDGDPLCGEPGDLFSQLATIITWRTMTLYSGPMSGLQEPLNISGKIGPIRPGQTLDLDLCISLPGEETGNVFQGATATTRNILITACSDEAEGRPETPGADPSDPSELPRTGGVALIPGMLAFLLILMGLLLNRRTAREKGM